MNKKQIQYFLKIVEMDSFSAASEELYISQSSLSKQIMSLEKELGIILFDRGKRQIKLTQAGKTFLPHAQAFLRTYQMMIADLELHQDTPSLAVVAIPVIAQYGITGYLAAFRNQFPHVKLNLEEREAHEVLSGLANGQYDLAFLRDNYLDKKTFDLFEVTDDKLSVVVSKNHPFANRDLISLHELTTENFIMFDKGTVVHEIAVDACREAGFEPRIFYASLRIESILGLVTSQSGITLMMEKVINYHKRPELTVVPLKEPVTSRIVLAHPRGRKLSHGAEFFLSFMKREMNRSHS
ncbi:MAG: transcriptional regulator [Anaerolineaceae bacterium]|nr:transcriptional regulator [Anaerolineaceae bacterium]